MKIEIQIRSILQHAWAEIEHDIGYKGEIEIPDDFKRNFNRVAALLELSDIEFVRIRDGLKNYENNISNIITKNPENVDLNRASLLSFITNSELVKRIDEKLCKETNCNLENVLPEGEYEIEMLKFLEINSIQSLSDALTKFENIIPKFAKNWLQGNDYDFNQGISIFYLCYIIIANSNDKDLAKNYMRRFFPHEKSLDNKVFEVYKQSIS